MLDLFLNLVALVALFAGLVWAYQRWIRPRAAGLGVPGLGLLLLIATAFMGGLLGSPFWWLDVQRSFAWDLPPLASRMLAAAGWSFAVASFLALERPTWARLRLLLLLLLTYLGPIVLAAALVHLDRFNFAAPITYGFFGLAGGMFLAALWYLARPPASLSRAAPARVPPQPAIRLFLAVVAVLTALWGLALFATDSGPLSWVWVWRGDLLSSRLIAVMLLTIAAGAAASLRDADRARLMLAMILTYGLGLAAASLWGVLARQPVRPGYLVAFGLIGLLAAALLLLPPQRREAVAPARGT